MKKILMLLTIIIIIAGCSNVDKKISTSELTYDKTGKIIYPEWYTGDPMVAWEKITSLYEDFLFVYKRKKNGDIEYDKKGNPIRIPTTKERFVKETLKNIDLKFVNKFDPNKPTMFVSGWWDLKKQRDLLRAGLSVSNEKDIFGDRVFLEIYGLEFNSLFYDNFRFEAVTNVDDNYKNFTGKYAKYKDRREEFISIYAESYGRQYRSGYRPFEKDPNKGIQLFRTPAEFAYHNKKLYKEMPVGDMQENNGAGLGYTGSYYNVKIEDKGTEKEPKIIEVGYYLPYTNAPLAISFTSDYFENDDVVLFRDTYNIAMLNELDCYKLDFIFEDLSKDIFYAKNKTRLAFLNDPLSKKFIDQDYSNEEENKKSLELYNESKNYIRMQVINKNSNRNDNGLFFTYINKCLSPTAMFAKKYSPTLYEMIKFISDNDDIFKGVSYTPGIEGSITMGIIMLNNSQKPEEVLGLLGHEFTHVINNAGFMVSFDENNKVKFIKTNVFDIVYMSQHYQEIKDLYNIKFGENVNLNAFDSLKINEFNYTDKSVDDYITNVWNTTGLDAKYRSFSYQTALTEFNAHLIDKLINSELSKTVTGKRIIDASQEHFGLSFYNTFLNSYIHEKNKNSLWYKYFKKNLAGDPFFKEVNSLLFKHPLLKHKSFLTWDNTGLLEYFNYVGTMNKITEKDLKKLDGWMDYLNPLDIYSARLAPLARPLNGALIYKAYNYGILEELSTGIASQTSYTPINISNQRIIKRFKTPPVFIRTVETDYNVGEKKIPVQIFGSFDIKIAEYEVKAKYGMDW